MASLSETALLAAQGLILVLHVSSQCVCSSACLQGVGVSRTQMHECVFTRKTPKRPRSCRTAGRLSHASLSSIELVEVRNQRTFATGVCATSGERGDVVLVDMIASISSKVLPLVSGTAKRTKTREKSVSPAYMPNTPGGVNTSRSPSRVKVITRFAKKFIRTAMDIAGPRTRSGKISEINSQTMGPKPIW